MVLRDLKVLMELRDFKVMMGHKEIKVLRVLLVLREHKV
jgi:hypothetical protein